MGIQAKIIAIIALVALSAFFSGVETALFSLSRLRAKYLARKGVHGASAVEKLKENPQKLLITILIGNNIMNVAAASLATSVAYDLSVSYAISLTTGIMTLILLIFGEITPKSISSKNSEKISLAVADLIRIIQILLFPIIIIFDYMTSAMTGTIGKSENPLVTEDEIKTFAIIGAESGQIKESEKEMIHRIFKFNDLEAKDVMTPRNKILKAFSKSKINETAELFYRKGHSRIPICKDSLDNITGFVHVTDVQKAILENRGNEGIGTIARPILFVPSVKKLDSLLRFLQRKKSHMAIVVNEFGTNIGLVTIDDLLEEIVGEIIDETEKIEPMIRKVAKNTYTVQGRADVDEINDKCLINLPEKEAPYTISSFILAKIGRIPKEGETITFPHCQIKISRMEQNTISEVIITVKKEDYAKKAKIRA